MRSAVLPLAARNVLHAVVQLEVGRYYRDVLRGDSGIIFEDGFQSVDKVLDPTTLPHL